MNDTKNTYKVNEPVLYFGTRHTVTATIADADTNELLSVIVKDDFNGEKIEVPVDYDFLIPFEELILCA
jgi:hypothetical protein